MLQSKFAEFLQLYSSIALVYSTYSLVSDLIQLKITIIYLLEFTNLFLGFITYLSKVLLS